MECCEQTMGSKSKSSCSLALLQLFTVVCVLFQCFAIKVDADQNTTLVVDASDASGRLIPETFFGIFFEVSSKPASKYWLCFLPSLFKQLLLLENY